MAKKAIKRNPRVGKRASKSVATTPTVPMLRTPSQNTRVKAIAGIIERSGHKHLWQQVIDNIRKTRGRPPAFDNIMDLVDAAEKYFKWADANPVEQHDIRGKDAKSVYLKHTRPYSLHAFCVFAGVSTMWWKSFKFSKLYNENENFRLVVAVIEETIRTQKFDGAVVGMFNSMIIARDLGLVDRIEKDVVDNRKQVADLFPEELKEK